MVNYQAKIFSPTNMRQERYLVHSINALTRLEEKAVVRETVGKSGVGLRIKWDLRVQKFSGRSR